MAAKHARADLEPATDRQSEHVSAAARDSSVVAGAGTGSAAGGENLDFLLDIPLEITIELGRTRMMINDLLKLGQGSIIELAKQAGDTLDILANNRLIAKGDVVVVNKKYAIRLTEVVSPVERVEKLG
jgi:flagellar motor switch protein FliN/FliY